MRRMPHSCPSLCLPGAKRNPLFKEREGESVCVSETSESSESTGLFWLCERCNFHRDELYRFEAHVALGGAVRTEASTESQGLEASRFLRFCSNSVSEYEEERRERERDEDTSSSHPVNLGFCSSDSPSLLLLFVLLLLSLSRYTPPVTLILVV